MTEISDRQIARHFIVGFSGERVAAESGFQKVLQRTPPAGVILFDRRLNQHHQGANIVSPAQLKSLTTELHATTAEPLLICVDQEGGLVQRLGARNGFEDFPCPQQLGTINRPDYTRQQSEELALVLKQHGIDVNFAPVVDLNRNPQNPIIGALGRAYSADPWLVQKHAAAFVDGHRTHQVITCLKHFPGHGSAEKDSHHGAVDLTKTWHQVELSPFNRLIQSGHADLVMVGHLFNQTIDPDYPATLSARTIDLLRRQLGYNGIIVADDLQMRAISEHYAFDQAICQALQAGIDIIIIGNNLGYVDNLLNMAIASVRHGLENRWLVSETLDKSKRRLDQLLKSVGRAR